MYIEGQPSTASTAAYGVAAVDENNFKIDVNGTLSMIEPVQVVSWATGTDDEIEAMINGYYEGRLSLDDIKSTWSVGDVRQANETDKAKMKIARHNTFDSASKVLEQSTCKQVIIDFNHDILKESIENIIKALVTIQMLGMLGTTASASELGVMKLSNDNSGGQVYTERRTQCNGNFYNALGFKSQIKQVKKEYCANRSSSVISMINDYCFLCSETEIFGNKIYSPGNEGIQYKYFETSSNRIKNQGQEGTGSAYNQQNRSVNSNNDSDFCYVSTSNNSGAKSATVALGIVPACAL